MSEIADQVSSSINALMEEFDTITHNIANVSTVGYKRRCSVFSIPSGEQEAGIEAESGGEVALNGTFDLSQGNIVETGRRLDFALYGKGFFVIETPEGALYTRNGVFLTNQNGQIVDSEGRIVAGEAGPIVIPTTVGLSQLNVSSDGSISAGGTIIGKFKLVNFEGDEDKLISVGASCYQIPDDIEPVTTEHTVVKQGYQEASNVKMIDELVNMIKVSRLYEANIKLVSAQKDASDSIMNVAMG